jgi:hypothetical protein
MQMKNKTTHRRQSGGAVAARVAVSDLEFCLAHLRRDESPRARLDCSENIDGHGQTEIACAHLLLNILEHTFATPHGSSFARSYTHTHTSCCARALCANRREYKIILGAARTHLCSSLAIKWTKFRPILIAHLKILIVQLNLTTHEILIVL